MELEQLRNTLRPILITGESGTGKSRFASTIHSESRLRDRPFMKVNLASLSSALFESELFGHQRGAFTGANTDKLGILESAKNGTVFIDEIGELDESKQVKLLHLLDDGTYYRVGSATPLQFKGRFIFATNKSLEKMVQEGSFRQDLYFRIRFCAIELPPLRLQSNTQLKREIWDQINNLKVQKKSFQTKFHPSLLEELSSYHWPGNFRELLNTIEYLFELNEPELTTEHLPSWIKSDDEIKIKSEQNYYYALERFERKYLEKVMYFFGGQINKTALEIGLSKVTLISKLKKYDIDRRQYKIRGEAVGF